ncbi:hypothetical protein RUM43_015033 [Polyplax serrata]|uniref:Uncharacterized protein n=1 Tax=Polyplax serrata TaxID=468196 RepID=A0AAN8PSJ7_POLSC
MWLLQFTSLVIIAVFAVEVLYELRVSDSYREDTYRKVIAYINFHELYNDNMAKYKTEKAQDYDLISTTTVMLTIKQCEENSACNVKFNYKRKSTTTIKQTEAKAKGGVADRDADYDSLPFLSKGVILIFGI